MKVAIITDQHFGARKNSKLFHDYFLKFYNDIFFPYSPHPPARRVDRRQLQHTFNEFFRHRIPGHSDQGSDTKKPLHQNSLCPRGEPPPLARNLPDGSPRR